MRKYFLLTLLFVFSLLKTSYSQTYNRGGIFSDQQWEEYDMVKRWIDSSQNVVIKPSVQKQLDDYSVKYPQNKLIVYRHYIFIKAMLNEKFSIEERIKVADYTLNKFKEYPKDIRFPLYVIEGIKVGLSNMKQTLQKK